MGFKSKANRILNGILKLCFSPFFDHVTRLFLEILNGKTLSFSLVSPSEKSAKFQLNLLNTLEVINREVKLVKKKNLSGTSGYPSSE